MTDSRELELVILSGDQKGARAPLQSGETIDISSSIDSYIAISDQSITNEKISLKINENSARLKIISGSATIMGRKLLAGKSQTLKMYQKVEMGKLCLAYGEVGSGQWPGGDNNVQFVSAKEIRAKVILSKIDRYLILKSILLLLLVTVGVLFSLGVANAISRHQGNSDIERNTENLVAKVREFGLEDMNLVTLENGELVIEGYIDEKEKYDEFSELVDKSNVRVKENIVLGDEVARKVKDIYRVNALVVETTTKEKGIVRVASKSSDLKKLNKIRLLALRDIKYLTNILITAEGGEVTFDQPAKRILMAVNGATAYVLTADGAKYYIGSELSSGHKIVEIQDDNIVLSKDSRKINFSL